MNRRQFLTRSLPVASLISASAVSPGRVLGANERVNLGWIGCGGRGRFVAGLLRAVPQVEFVAVCDVYEPRCLAAKEWAGQHCRVSSDFRSVLEQKDVDAVLIATPDHWHAIPTVLACQAGKDVYVEKPLAHNVKEGQAMVAAARRFNRIVQVGLQQRSAPHYAEAARLIQSSALGPVHFVRIWNYLNSYPNGLGRKPDSDPPPGVDWEMYLGPAPMARFNPNRFVGTYRWFWDYAGGLLTDYGTHRFDSLHQIMGADAPLSVAATGNLYELHDGRDTPDVIQATFEYPGFVLNYEATNLNAFGTGGRTPGQTYYLSRGQHDYPHGEAFYGPNGTLFSNRLGFEVFPELKAAVRGEALVAGAGGFRMEPKASRAEDATGLHARNFVECVRSRQPPAAPAEAAHRSTIVAHLGNIAYRTGRKLRWDATKEEIIGDPEAAKLLARQARKPWDLI